MYKNARSRIRTNGSSVMMFWSSEGYTRGLVLSSLSFITMLKALCREMKLGCTDTTRKMKFSIKDFFRKCDEIRRKLWIWSHLLKKSLMGHLIFAQWKVLLYVDDVGLTLSQLRIEKGKQRPGKENWSRKSESECWRK